MSNESPTFGKMSHPQESASWSLARFNELRRPLGRPIAPLREKTVTIALPGEFPKDRQISLEYQTVPPRVDSGFRRRPDTSPILVDISDCLILPNGTLLCDDTLFVDAFRSAPLDWRHSGWYGVDLREVGFYGYNQNDESAVMSLSSKGLPPVVKAGSFFLFHCFYSYSNFGHFIHDLLAQLWAYDMLSAKLGSHIRPLMTVPEHDKGYVGFRYPAQREIFEALISPFHDVTLVGSAGFRGSHVYSTTQMLPVHGSPNLSYTAFEYLRHRLRLLAKRAGTSTSRGPRLYVSRRDTTHLAGRQFSNLDALEEMLKRNGYSPVVVSALSPKQIFGTFYRATKVIGIHGAGLLNGLFADSQLEVVELMDFPESWDSIESVSVASGLIHRRVAARPPKNSESRPELDVTRVQELFSS